MSIAVSDFLRLALMEIRSARAGDVVQPDDAGDALLIFNELLDGLNATPRAIYTNAFTTFTLTANLQPHTIGLAANTPTFTVTIGRPARIVSANLILSNNIRVPLDLLNAQQWNAISAGAAAGQAVTITSAVPMGLYYDPAWPTGNIYLWPVPDTAYGLELQTATLLAQVLSSDTFDLPFGYQQALRLTLAERLAPAFGQSVSRETAKAAQDARALIWGDNDEIPNAIADAGVPMGARGCGFNFLTGQVE